MTSLGSKLRHQRERLGLTVPELATQTKIRDTYLEAIENDQLETIPGGFFSRSFVRQYARALGLKQDEIEQELQAVTVPPQDTLEVERILAEYRPSNAPRSNLMPGEEKEEAEPAYLHQAEFLRDSGTGKHWLALAVLLILASAAYLTWRQRPELFAGLVVNAHDQKLELPPLPRPPAPRVEIPPVQIPEASPVKNVADQTPDPPQRQAETTARAVEVAVVAKEKAWVRLITDGTKTFGGTLEAGERRVLNGAASAVVFTGNAGGLELTYNGRALGAVGPRGLVRTAVFTPQGYEIRTSSPGIDAEPPAAYVQP